MSDNRTASKLVAEPAEVVRDLPDDEVAAELRALRAAVEKFSVARDCRSSCHHCPGIHAHCRNHCIPGHCNCSAWHYINTTINATSTVTPPAWMNISGGSSTVTYPFNPFVGG